ncbi:MAG: hypothetical protein F6J90_07035 [Moorea sp. SIOASIH]|uniref:hypothetical protein n=1 Tax=Moorena sp. SIOASIH TaxID=2607817 RepID=UPI0013BB084F|nr:hypothetical protein [Moorena sp. SIOASIH]NEO36092.1 hypothetical protein [Moorena sp. SIOASIH]
MIFSHSLLPTPYSLLPIPCSLFPVPDFSKESHVQSSWLPELLSRLYALPA